MPIDADNTCTNHRAADRRRGTGTPADISSGDRFPVDSASGSTRRIEPASDVRSSNDPGRMPVQQRVGGQGNRSAGLSALSQAAQTALPIAGMLAMLLMVYRRLMVGRVLAGGDLQIYFYPYWMQVVRSLREGHLPLWNPYLFAGAPLAANSQVGLFYPLNWPFWLLSALLDGNPVSWVGIPSAVAVVRALHLNVLIHIFLAAIFCWGLCRRIGLSSWAASLAGLVYAGGGFLGLHLDHLNQFQALAWLPLLFLPVVQVRSKPRKKVLSKRKPVTQSALRWEDRRLPSPWSVLAMGLIVLSGHLQVAFIAAVGLSIWHIVDVVVTWLQDRDRSMVPATMLRLLFCWLVRLLPYALAGLLASIQLLPTLQLAGVSARSAGLDWREAVSFSIPPWELARVLLPTYLLSPLLPEGVAYIGVTGLALAAVAAVVALVRAPLRPTWIHWLILTGSGVFLALGAYNPLYLAATRLHVPGFIQFRAPARFLALYGLGAAVLAGMGSDYIGRRFRLAGLTGRPRRLVVSAVGAVVLLGVGLELTVAAEALPHSRATAARSYWDLRPATAHLVAGRAEAEATGRVPNRFLSISQMLFEIGDKAEVEAIYGDQLSEDALWSYMVAAKQREILAPNLPLAFGVPAVDGYDGGLLPLRHYIAFSELLIPGGTLDGRLRENLLQIPDDRWLDLLGVQYLLTDKTGDLWVDDILYDRQFQPLLAGAESLHIGWLPADFDATALGVLYVGDALQVSLALADGRRLVQTLPPRGAGEETAWMRWSSATQVTAVSFAAGPDGTQIVATSLVDERVRAFYPLTLSDRFRLAHSGDVKIYEMVVSPSRAVLLHDCRPASNLDEARDAMAKASFGPNDTVVVDRDGEMMADCRPGEETPFRDGESVEIVSYTDNKVVIDATLNAAGYLLLKDAWYPGWQVRVRDTVHADSQPINKTPMRANLLFRVAALEAGTWRVTFRYVPYILYSGLILSLGGIGSQAAYTLLIHRWRSDRTVH